MVVAFVVAHTPRCIPNIMEIMMGLDFPQVSKQINNDDIAIYKSTETFYSTFHFANRISCFLPKQMCLYLYVEIHVKMDSNLRAYRVQRFVPVRRKTFRSIFHSFLILSHKNPYPLCMCVP